jgi:hypothetical protein
MYYTGTGQWMEEDPIQFDAGDPNLRRYVGNDPTNVIDPTGFQGKGPAGLGDYTFEYDRSRTYGILFGLGPNEPEATFYTNVKASSTRVGGKLPLPGILLTYKGKNANKVTFIQFKKFVVEVQAEKDGGYTQYDGSFKAHGEIHQLSTTKTGPLWDVDALDEATPNYIKTTGLQGGLVSAPAGGGLDMAWMFDAPASPIDALEVAHKDLVVDKKQPVERLVAHGIFSTYIVVNGGVICRFDWESVAPWNKGEPFNKDALYARMRTQMLRYGSEWRDANKFAPPAAVAEWVDLQTTRLQYQVLGKRGYKNKIWTHE